MSGNRTYIDIETDPDGGKKCIWAVTVVRDGGTPLQWILRRLTGQWRMLKSVGAYLSTVPSRHLGAYSGSRFDERMLIHHFLQHRITVPSCLEYAADIHPAVCRAVALPGSYRLKEVLPWFKVEHQASDMDGRTAASIAMCALYAGRLVPQELLLYNREDARALRDLVKALSMASGVAAPQLRRMRHGMSK
jgi:RNase_H superfamily